MGSASGAGVRGSRGLHPARRGVAGRSQRDRRRAEPARHQAEPDHIAAANPLSLSCFMPHQGSGCPAVTLTVRDEAKRGNPLVSLRHSVALAFSIPSKHPLREVIKLVPEGDPAMSGFLPNGAGRGRKRGIDKPTNSHADMVRPSVQLPKQIRPAGRAEMIPELSPLWRIANVNCAGPLDPNLLPVEIGAHAKGRAGSTLAFTAMAGHNKSWIA